MTILKKTLRTTGICISIFMVMWYAVSGIINIGSLFGILFFTCLGSCCIFSKRFFEIVRKIRSNKVGKIIFGAITAVFMAGILYIIIMLGAMTAFSMRTPEANSTLVVLGCQVNGTNPSLMLRLRLETAYQYMTENPEVKCIVSGGKGSNEQISEAQCMYNWLVDKGISSDRIYMEDKSTNTQENIEFSEEIIKKEGLNENIAIVTDWYHEFRAAIIADKLGYSCGSVSAPTPFYLTANFVTRELLALTNEIVFN